MPSNEVKVEPHVLRFLRQVEEPPVAPRRSDGEISSLPKLTRKLSEPLHKSSVPLKSILKSKRSESMSDAAAPSERRPRVRLQAPVKNSIPLALSHRKSPPRGDYCNSEEAPDSAVSSESDEEMFYTPGSVRSDEDPAALSNNFYTDPPTPMPTPTLRTSFSQDIPYQGYPLTPHNTFRRKRRTPPIVDELDRQKNGIPFPTRQSFTFTQPLNTPSPSEFPLPPGAVAAEVGSGIPAQRAVSRMSKSLSWTARRMSWHPSLPILTRRSQDKASTQRPEVDRIASKRKSSTDVEGTTKRRKVVRFASSEDHKERERTLKAHPPMRRRPTPYYEPFSAKLWRIFRRLVARFRKQSEEEKEQRETAKAMRKAAKRARKEREELKDSYRHFDDTVD